MRSRGVLCRRFLYSNGSNFLWRQYCCSEQAGDSHPESNSASRAAAHADAAAHSHPGSHSHAKCHTDAGADSHSESHTDACAQPDSSPDTHTDASRRHNCLEQRGRHAELAHLRQLRQ